MIRQSFPWWYFWVKWVLPISLALATSAWLGLTLTATIPAYGMLKWAPVLFSSLEGFSAVAALTFAMGAVASMIGVGTSILMRAVLSSVSEDIAITNITHVSFLDERYRELTTQYEALRTRSTQEREESDKALEWVGQRNDALMNQLTVQPLPIQPTQEPTPPVDAANDETKAARRGRKKATVR